MPIIGWLATTLKVCTNLETIDLSAIGIQGTEVISHFLKGNTSLCSINLKDNMLDDDDAVELARALDCNGILLFRNVGSELYRKYPLGVMATGFETCQLPKRPTMKIVPLEYWKYIGRGAKFARQMELFQEDFMDTIDQLECRDDGGCHGTMAIIIQPP